MSRPAVRPTATLIVVSGLPATGKTTIAGLLAEQLRVAYVRIDTIERWPSHNFVTKSYAVVLERR